MYETALTLTLTIGFMALVALIGKMSEYTVIKKAERRRLNRCSWELYYVKQAIDRKITPDKIIELKNYVKKATA